MFKDTSKGEKMEWCEYCGPKCYSGACHNARVEVGDEWGTFSGEMSKEYYSGLQKGDLMNVIMCQQIRPNKMQCNREAKWIKPGIEQLDGVSISIYDPKTAICGVCAALNPVVTADIM